MREQTRRNAVKNEMFTDAICIVWKKYLLGKEY
jgi:hypothetical protein